MNWAFVDYENVGSLEALNISAYERVFVFCGPKNTKIKVGALPSDGFCRIELIGVTTMGANNLDFHLAFHLGRFHEVAEKGVAFHVISNDSGFNGLVSHLKKLGRNCKKVGTKEATPKQPAPLSLSGEASLVVARLKQLDGRKRPRKKASFLNWIKSQCQGLSNRTSPESVCKELVSAKVIRESGSDIAYEIER
ncbi:PIN domain-containing protein [Nitrosococcus wardiae]|uniref:PIN-like domain-containing protein n=1 Tax=Nitrosococcus wardiae TaxID=1814290 RepID=A0A4P7BWC2_9GAMM|nr:PIN domain-containing protein [Nitrosococcus wardiae]QBQ53380.1 hypothetical protein E3U44_01810 [Nitrosococcus wardiae]